MVWEKCGELDVCRLQGLEHQDSTGRLPCAIYWRYIGRSGKLKTYLYMRFKIGISSNGLDNKSMSKTAFVTAKGKNTIFKVPLVDFGHKWRRYLINYLLLEPICMTLLYNQIVQKIKDFRLLFTFMSKKGNCKIENKVICMFRSSIQLFGHIIHKDGIKPGPAQIQSTKIWYLLQL